MGSSSLNNVDNKAKEMEYWPHQWLEAEKLMTTTASDTTSQKLIPIFKKTANTSIITSAGQTVYLHCHVENLGERSVSSSEICVQNLLRDA